MLLDSSSDATKRWPVPRYTFVTQQHTTPSATRHLVVEGWRSICQSYAVINQWQLLAMARRPGSCG